MKMSNAMEVYKLLLEIQHVEKIIQCLENIGEEEVVTIETDSNRIELNESDVNSILNLFKGILDNYERRLERM